MAAHAGAAEYDAVVVGAGHNGLVSAFYLARAGLRVLTLERRSLVGGACVTEELFEGYRISSCSYLVWLLQPKVVHDMQLPRRGFHFQPLDPWRVNPQRDGSILRFWKDERRTQAELARINAHDAATYPAFNAFWDRAVRLIQPFFLREPPSKTEVRTHARSIGEEDLLDHLLVASVADVADEFFHDDRVKAALVKMGESGNPWTRGSGLTEAYFHANADVGYGVVTGGMGAITQAMAKAVRDVGGTIRTGATVERILVRDGTVRGVHLASGEEIRAPIVISNADPKRTYLRLLGPDDLSPDFHRDVENLSTRTSYLKFHCVMEHLPDLTGYLGPDSEPRDVGYVHLAPSLDHFRRAHEDAMQGEPAREPIAHLQVPTVYDRSLTNRHGHIVSIWALYAPPRLAHGTWEKRRTEVAENLIDYVTEFIPNFRRDIRQYRLFTPADLERRVGLTDGNIRHLDTIPTQFLDQRPLPGAGYATPIRGLYLCGAGTHPGGEVSGAPGHNAAHVVLRDMVTGTGVTA